MLDKNKNTIIKISESLMKDVDLNILDSRGKSFSYRVIEGTPNTEYSGLVLYNCIVKNDIPLKGAFSLHSSSQLEPNLFLKRMIVKLYDDCLTIEEGIHLESCTLSFLKLFDWAIPNSTFENINFKNVSFDSCKLDGSKFKNCTFEGVQFTECEYDSGNIGSYRNMRFENCTFEAYLLGERQFGDDYDENIQRTVFKGDFENTFFDEECELSADGRYIDGVEYGIRNDDSIVFESDDIEWHIRDFSPNNLD